MKFHTKFGEQTKFSETKMSAAKEMKEPAKDLTVHKKPRIVYNGRNKKEEKFFDEDVLYCVDYENWNKLVGYATITKHGFVTKDEAVDFIIKTITSNCEIVEDGENLRFNKTYNSEIGHL